MFFQFSLLNSENSVSTDLAQIAAEVGIIETGTGDGKN